jgi:hypothetical protein
MENEYFLQVEKLVKHFLNEWINETKYKELSTFFGQLQPQQSTYSFF